MTTGSLSITNTGSTNIYVIPSAKGYCNPTLFPVQPPNKTRWCTNPPQTCAALVGAGITQGYNMAEIPPDNTLGVQIFTSTTSSTPIWEGAVINNTHINFDSGTGVMEDDNGNIIPDCGFSPFSPPVGTVPITNTGTKDIYVISSGTGYCDPLAFPVNAPNTTTSCPTVQCTNVLVSAGSGRSFKVVNPTDGIVGVQVFDSPSSTTPVWQGSSTNNASVSFDSDTNVMTYTDGSTVPPCPPPTTQPQPPKLGGFSEEALIYWGIAFAVIIILFIAFLAFRRK